MEPAPEPTLAPVPLIDWDAVAASPIEITNDGSVVVHGIPKSIATEYGEVIAQIATDAALKHWRRTRTSRPTPSRDDRRLFTKAAKEALRKHAAERQPDTNGPGVPRHSGAGAIGIFSCLRGRP